MTESYPHMASERLRQAVARHLFAERELNTYAILDGAAVPGLLDRLAADSPEHVCLYRGEMQPDLAECAPYLVVLKENSGFTNWVFQECWGKHGGIFALAPTDLKDTRKHFRTFLIVKDPDGKQLYFRYYDPRVLRIYLPTCNPEETAAVFGPVRHYLLEDENPAILLRFSPDQTPPRREAVNLSSP
jgi:hypothetical protein